MHIWFNLLVVILLWIAFIWWDLVPTSPWGKFHPVPTAMLIVIMISIRTHSVLNTGHIQTHSVSIGIKIGFHYFFQSPWFWCIIIVSGLLLCWVSRGVTVVVGRLHVSKKKRRGLIHLSALYTFDEVI